MKDKLHRIGGVTNFPVTREVLDTCRQAHTKYVAELDKKRAEEKERTERVKKDEERVQKNKTVALQISDLDRLIRFTDVIFRMDNDRKKFTL